MWAGLGREGKRRGLLLPFPSFPSPPLPRSFQFPLLFGEMQCCDRRERKKGLVEKVWTVLFMLKAGPCGKFCENSSVKCVFCSASGLHHSSCVHKLEKILMAMANRKQVMRQALNQLLPPSSIQTRLCCC